MLASLAGGASCGPSNPLQQLSKTYGQDRGVAQDQFGGGGPAGSQNAFRQHPSSSSTSQLPNDPSAQHFFQQPPPSQQQQQPFDLTPLNRALSPSHAHDQRSSPAPPPWATAFQQHQQQQQPSANSAQEQELFARAFGGGARSGEQQNQQWRSEFQAHPGGGGQQMLAPSAATQQQQQQVGGMPVQAQRLYGQGFAQSMPMMQQGGMAFGPGMGLQEGRSEGEVVQGRRDWEKAFLAQESTSTSAFDATTSTYEGITETRPLTPPLRSHSPLSGPVARDALAQTAADLLSTVQSAEAQRVSDHSSTLEQADVGNKFANSSFMSFMRQLRDGEVAVEGDKVVDQVQPYSSASAISKGKARADGWASDFSATLNVREEEGRVGEAPPVFKPGDGVEQFARAQHDWAARQARSAQVVRDLQDGYSTMEGMWDDEDRARAARELEKGKGKERETGGYVFQGDGGRMVGEEDQEMQAETHVPLAQASWEEDLDDASFIAGGHAPPGLAARSRTAESGPSAQQREWDMLQGSWDDFEVTATGLQSKHAPSNSAQASTSTTAHGYSFAQNNPYIARHQPTSHHHAYHDNSGALASALYDRHDSLLQHEANVQRDPHNASAWLELGLKQQQNEREELAIAALRRAVELDPSVANGGAHLGLAVSFTNEGRRYEAYEEIDRWISTLGRAERGNRAYANEIEQYREVLGQQLPQGMKERLDYLSGLLIRLAQSGQEAMGGIDADVQVALGVLFNSSEDYEKASDCFSAALSVRPDDPLLFNRLGATYANSGKTDTAIEYYLAALDLDPGYVRARYNLAVANMNLSRYNEAVGHLLTSLEIQDTDSEQDHLEQAPATSGITSSTLWDSLNVSLLQMHRSDLSAMAAEHDLKGLQRAWAVMM